MAFKVYIIFPRYQLQLFISGCLTAGPGSIMSFFVTQRIQQMVSRVIDQDVTSADSCSSAVFLLKTTARKWTGGPELAVVTSDGQKFNIRQKHINMWPARVAPPWLTFHYSVQYSWSRLDSWNWPVSSEIFVTVVSMQQVTIIFKTHPCSLTLQTSS